MLFFYYTVVVKVTRPPKVQFKLEIRLNGHAKRRRIFSCAAASKKSKRHAFWTFDAER